MTYEFVHPGVEVSFSLKKVTVDKEECGWIYYVLVGVASCENAQNKDGRRAKKSRAKRRASRSFRIETYDIDFYARNNASAPAVEIVDIAEKRRLGLCVATSLCDCVFLQKEIFFPIPRNRRRYVRIRSVRFYELHDIFFISRSHFLVERNESEEIVMFRIFYNEW